MAARSRGLGQRPSSGNQLQLPGGSAGLGGAWSSRPSFGGAFFGPGPFGFGAAGGASSSSAGPSLGGRPSSSPSLSSAGGAGSPVAGWQGQVPSGGSYTYGPSYPGSWGQYYFPGQFVQSPSYGNGAYWGALPGQWGLSGTGYGFGGSYGSANPFGFGFGAPSFGNGQVSAGVSQAPAGLPGASRGSSGSSPRLQSQVQRQ